MKSQINKAINEATDEVLSLRLDQTVIKQNLTKEEKRAVFSLRDRDGIVYLKADKGNRLVVLTENQYDDKMNDILNDTNVYKKVEDDPTTDHLKTLTAFLESAVVQGKITEEKKNLLLPLNPQPGHIHGLPKIHKEGVPLRPIVAQINTPTRLLSEHVEKVLSPYVKKWNHMFKIPLTLLTFLKVNTVHQISQINQ